MKGKFSNPVEGRLHVKAPVSYEENKKVLAEERRQDYAQYQEKVHFTYGLCTSIDLHLYHRLTVSVIFLVYISFSLCCTHTIHTELTVCTNMPANFSPYIDSLVCWMHPLWISSRHFWLIHPLYMYFICKMHFHDHLNWDFGIFFLTILFFTLNNYIFRTDSILCARILSITIYWLQGHSLK